MKTTIILALCLITSFGQAQNLMEKDVLGAWVLSIDIDQKIMEETEDLTSLERLLVRGASGFVQEVLDAIDLHFDFQPDGLVLLSVKVPTDDSIQKEPLTWSINDEGYLIIHELKSEHTQINFDALWQLDGAILQAYDQDTREKEHMILSRR